MFPSENSTRHTKWCVTKHDKRRVGRFVPSLHNSAHSNADEQVRYPCKSGGELRRHVVTQWILLIKSYPRIMVVDTNACIVAIIEDWSKLDEYWLKMRPYCELLRNRRNNNLLNKRLWKKCVKRVEFGSIQNILPNSCVYAVHCGYEACTDSYPRRYFLWVSLWRNTVIAGCMCVELWLGGGTDTNPVDWISANCPICMVYGRE